MKFYQAVIITAFDWLKPETKRAWEELIQFGKVISITTSSYHDLTVDRDENIYVGDILGNTIQKFKRVSIP